MGEQGKQNENDVPNKLFVTDETFEMYEIHQSTPITDMILESYGQVGVPNDREEKERNDET
ncbi:hypothetical protein [Laceyella putida]|uniref:Uncharacterized protein n=1 Tax=Laceyella putida TaxID=110101 RepID=A0ABW2RK14_9BACL